MTEFLLQAFIALLVVIDPVGMSPIFVGLTRAGQPQFQRRMAWRGVGLATVVLVAFAFGGPALLGFLGIGLPAFRIAGGVMLFLIAVDMLFARPSGLRSTTEGEMEEAAHQEDISVFPLAIPLIAGPGAMTTVVLLMGKANGQPAMVAAVVGTMIAVLGLTLISLLFSVRMTALLGVTGSNVISRVLGIVLAALAVQFALDGLLTSALFLGK